MNTAKHNIAHRTTGIKPGRVLLCVMFLLCSTLVMAGDAGLNVLALSAQDQKAVVRTAAGEMKAVAPGDVLAEQQLTVEKVMADKLVLKDNTTNDEIWISLAVPGKNSEITRLSKQIPKNEMPEPATITIPRDVKNLKRSKHGQ